MAYWSSIRVMPYISVGLNNIYKQRANTQVPYLPKTNCKIKLSSELNSSLICTRLSTLVKFQMAVEMWCVNGRYILS